MTTPMSEFTWCKQSRQQYQLRQNRIPGMLSPLVKPELLPFLLVVVGCVNMVQCSVVQLPDQPLNELLCLDGPPKPCDLWTLKPYSLTAESWLASILAA